MQPFLSLAAVFVCGLLAGLLIARRFAIPYSVKLLIEGMQLKTRAEKIIRDLEKDNDSLRQWVLDVLPLMKDAEAQMTRLGDLHATAPNS